MHFVSSNWIYFYYGVFAFVEFIALSLMQKKYPFLETVAAFTSFFIKKYLTHIILLLGFKNTVYFIYQHRLFTFQPSGILAVISFVICIDFIYYWHHRLSHKIKIFWIMHSVHHLPTRLTILTSLQRSMMEYFYSAFTFLIIPGLILGFSPKTIFYFFGLNLVYQAWIHNEFIGKLGILEYYLNTPAKHRIHHSLLPQHANKNFGGIFCIFDRLFGTFHLDDVECSIYGVLPEVKITSPLTPVFYEFSQWKNLILDFNKTPGLKNKISVLIKV